MIAHFPSDGSAAYPRIARDEVGCDLAIGYSICFIIIKRLWWETVTFCCLNASSTAPINLFPFYALYFQSKTTRFGTTKINGTLGFINWPISAMSEHHEKWLTWIRSVQYVAKDTSLKSGCRSLRNPIKAGFRLLQFKRWNTEHWSNFCSVCLKNNEFRQELLFWIEFDWSADNDLCVLSSKCNTWESTAWQLLTLLLEWDRLHV